MVFGAASGITSVNLDDVALGIGGFKITGETTLDLTGFSVSSAGDVNGDGFDDLIVGAFGNPTGGSNAGAAYVLFGGNFTGAVSQLSATAVDTPILFDIDDSVILLGVDPNQLDANDVLI